jgi:hypothetical protein
VYVQGLGEAVGLAAEEDFDTRGVMFVKQQRHLLADPVPKSSQSSK